MWKLTAVSHSPPFSLYFCLKMFHYLYFERVFYNGCKKVEAKRK